VLPTTTRSGPMDALADAEIAWVHAYQRQQWHRIGRLVAGAFLLFGSMIQYASLLATRTS